MNITVAGSGGWGLAMAKLLAEKGHAVSVWSHRPETTRLLREKRCNPKLLSGVTLPEHIDFTDRLDGAGSSPIVVLATPSYAVAETAERLRPFLHPGQTMVLLSKGFDLDHGCCLLSDTVSRVLGPEYPVVALTGPSHAEEVSRGIPTAVVAACPRQASAELVQEACSNSYFRVYTSPDLVSAELGGAMKNIMAIAVGVSDGYGFGDNTKAMLMTRGITEMSRLGVLLGGREETFAGLSGVGDLIVTCISQHSRNRRAGLLIGRGATAQQALQQVGAVVEGYFATRAVHELTAGQQVSMPICEAMYDILFREQPLPEVIEGLFRRSSRAEHDSHNNGWS